jgi:hypothetical protein
LDQSCTQIWPHLSPTGSKTTQHCVNQVELWRSAYMLQPGMLLLVQLSMFHMWHAYCVAEQLICSVYAVWR